MVMVTAKRPRRSTAAKQPKACALPQPDGWECIREDAHEPPCARTPTRDLDCPVCEDQPHPDEALQARCDALATALRNLIRAHESVVEHCIDPRQHMFAEQQERMWRAKQAVDNAAAVLVESEGK